MLYKVPQNTIDDILRPEQAPEFLSEGFGLRAEAQGELGILKDAQTFQADAEQAPGNVPVADSY